MNRLICSICKKTYSLDQKIWRCHCGGLLDLSFKAEFPITEIEKRKPSIWRYREAIPVDDDKNIISLDEGFTPLTEIEFNSKTVLIKQDQLMSTGSFKDRGASVLVSYLKGLGIDRVVEDSSGNAGCAIAAYCARAGIKCEIFVPESISQEKMNKIRFFGVNPRIVSGSREDTTSAALKAAENTYYASHAWNPFFLHGTKTFAYEICEQLGWRSPDTIILPCGNGTLLLGTYIGFKDLMDAKIINRLPRMIAVQSANCAPLAKAFNENLSDIPGIEKKETIAGGIAIAKPIRGKEILSAVKDTVGHFITVDDDEILRSLNIIRRKGFDIEPTGAATVAGLRKYLIEVSRSEMIVSVFSGQNR